MSSGHRLGQQSEGRQPLEEQGHSLRIASLGDTEGGLGQECVREGERVWEERGKKCGNGSVVTTAEPWLCHDAATEVKGEGRGEDQPRERLREPR